MPLRSGEYEGPSDDFLDTTISKRLLNALCAKHRLGRARRKAGDPCFLASLKVGGLLGLM